MAIEHSRQLLAAGKLQHTLEAGARRSVQSLPQTDATCRLGKPSLCPYGSDCGLFVSILRCLGRALSRWRLATHGGMGPTSSSQHAATQPVQSSINLSRYRPLIRRVVATYLEQRLAELLPPPPPPSDGQPFGGTQSTKEQTQQLAATRLVGAYRKSQVRCTTIPPCLAVCRLLCVGKCRQSRSTTCN